MQVKFSDHGLNSSKKKFDFRPSVTQPMAWKTNFKFVFQVMMLHNLNNELFAIQAMT